MKINSIFLMASLLLLCTFSCTAPIVEETPAIDLDQVKAELQAMEDAYAAAENANDADAVVHYYADDAVNLPNNQPPAVGKAAILERIKADLAADTSSSTMVFEVQNVWAAGDLAVEVGSSTSTDAAGNVTTGKYISVFEKRDGKYVCVRDIWNNDAPDDDDDGDSDD